MPGAPVIAFLCGAARPPSRARLEAAATALGARSLWLDPHALEDLSLLPERPDVVVARSGGYTDDAALAAIRRFEAAGAPCLPSSGCVEVVRDKLLAARALRVAGVSVPTTVAAESVIGHIDAHSDSVLVHSGHSGTETESALRFPLVVKARCGMRGEGIALVQSSVELDAALMATSPGGEPSTPRSLLVQQYVGDGSGTDLRVMVVGGRALGAISRTPAEDDFRANAHRGAAVAMSPLTPELEDIALAATTALGLPFAGVDLMRDAPSDARSGRWLVLEVNSSPGFEAFEATTGVDVAAAIVAEALRHVDPRR